MTLMIVLKDLYLKFTARFYQEKAEMSGRSLVLRAYQMERLQQRIYPVKVLDSAPLRSSMTYSPTVSYRY